MHHVGLWQTPVAYLRTALVIFLKVERPNRSFRLGDTPEIVNRFNIPLIPVKITLIDIIVIRAC